MGSQLLAVLREALMNVAKHAEATRTEVSLDVAADSVTLVVIDDGVGMAEGSRRPVVSACATSASGRTRLGGEVEFSEVEPRGHAGPLGRAAPFGVIGDDQWSVLALTANTAASVRRVMPSFIKIDDM